MAIESDLRGFSDARSLSGTSGPEASRAIREALEYFGDLTCEIPSRGLADPLREFLTWFNSLAQGAPLDALKFSVELGAGLNGLSKSCFYQAATTLFETLATSVVAQMNSRPNEKKERNHENIH